MAEVVVGSIAAATIVSGLMSAKPILWDPIKEAINVSRDMEKLHEDLKESIGSLLAKKEIHEKTLASWKSMKKPSVVYNNWIQEVTKLEKHSAELDVKYEKRSKSSKFVRSFTCSNMCKKMRKLSEVAARLETRQMGDISSRKEPDRVVLMKEAPDIDSFPTLFEPLCRILGLLVKKKIKGIEIHGMMGTGKTSIMQNINNNKNVASMFDLVIWVNVSSEHSTANFTVTQMQKRILHRLNLDDGECANNEESAKMIRKELWDKKCLLLLDGVKEDLQLSEIGIDLNYESGSKLVLTSRKLRVCDFIVDQVIQLRRLSDKEAMFMFKKILGTSARNSGPVLFRVVKCCDNLPFVIKMIASAFKRRETEQNWVDGYNNLRKFPNEGDAAIQKVYNYLDFCCNDLDGAQKDCFLYCALYPEEMKISADCLLDCWGAEDLYGINKVRELGRHVLDELKKASLLEEHVSENREFVKMHKLIRKVALDKLLADIEHKHMVKAGESLEDQPHLKEWNEMHRISLADNQIKALSECPDCPSLSTLLLQRNGNLKMIHNSFFENTQSLRVLDLCHTGIPSLPSSLRNLKLLKVLYLNDCSDLVKLPVEIGELENLEVLDVRGLKDDNIPNQNEGMLAAFQNLVFRRSKLGPPLTNIHKLHNLKRLLVSFNVLGNENDAQYVSKYCDVISQVSTTLEELVIDVKSYKQRCNEMINIVREKVTTTMPKLTTLTFCFEDGVEDVMKVVAGTPHSYYPVPDDLTNFVRKLDVSASKSFQLFIGCSISSLPQIAKRHKYKRYLKYLDGRGSNHRNISKVLSITDAFELVNHKDIINVSEFGNDSLYEIQACFIEDCSNITGIADGDCVLDGPLLPSVRRLYIKKLPKLESIWKKALHLWSLSLLKTLHVDDCPNMEALLVEPATLSILPNLRNLVLVNLPNLTRICTKELPNWPLLEELKIHKCQNLTDFPFSKDNTSKLKKLILDDMANFKLICAYESLEWPALEKLKIHGCPSIKELPFNITHAKQLMIVKADKKWWDGLQWNDLDMKARLEPYCLFQEDTVIT